ncbi:MAG: CpsD/CapB family tyrosine-protein kinase, partial [Mariniphaga sp.]|nr:CpsD/CapB family tyrosine-protein kinase [Mariniphaga sp.]
FNEPNKKVISVNSLVSGEGKSFISTNFAATLSLSGKRVLLVGTDLRNPTLHTFLGTKQDIGLSSFLNNESGFDEIINQSSSENLFYVLAGEVPDNPSELLENGMFEQFLNIARERFDYIVLDNAPIKLVPDANWTNRYSDINLFILRLKYSRQAEIPEINKMVTLNEIKNSYLVINDTAISSYGYGNKYWRKGYGNYHKKTKTA